ncbi:MAG TPA: hypothetical protein VJQ09_03040 [Candidatus Limnocylindria bacterium]|nr:hypothetical protein [Candidatus Limnocylindria bacterium]
MPSDEGREVLRLLAEKKIDAEQAYRLLLALGDVPKAAPETEAGVGASTQAEPRTKFGDAVGRVLRIRISEGGKQKVNMSVPLSLARLGRVAGLSRMVRRFGVDLRDVARDISSVGKIIDICDEDGDRVEIYVE